jgi:prevent-host-death family protein
MAVVSIHVAKTTLSKLLARVEAGEEIILARGKTPIARVVPIRPEPAKRRFGSMRGRVSVGPQFFEPLPESEIETWE